MIRFKAVLVAFLLMVGNTVYGQSVKVTGNETAVPAGELVILRFKVEGPNVVKAKYKARVYEIDKVSATLREKTRTDTREDANGLTVVFGAGLIKNQYAVSYSVAYSEKNDKGEVADNLVLETALVNVDGPPGPTPTPVPPTPTPNPDPIPVPPAPKVVPDGDYGLVKKTYNWVNSVNDPNKVKIASELAKNYDGVAAQIAAGTIPNIGAAMLQLKNTNTASVVEGGSTVAVWEPFVGGLAQELLNLYNAGRLNTFSVYPAVFREVADGIRYSIGEK